jgi:hypothetical protein
MNALHGSFAQPVGKRASALEPFRLLQVETVLEGFCVQGKQFEFHGATTSANGLKDFRMRVKYISISKMKFKFKQKGFACSRVYGGGSRIHLG